MTEIQDTGFRGEEIASQYLEKKGYSIKVRNWKYMQREIDIVAIYQKELVIVEVKTRAANYIVSPSAAVSNKKQRLLIDAANLYIQKHNIDMDIRFDIICIVYNNDNYSIEHIENAFYPKVK